MPGDLTPAEIDRIMRDAFLVLRRHGSEALARMTFVREPRHTQRQHIGLASREVLESLQAQPQTVYDLADSLKWTYFQVHGVMSWLRKQNKIQVAYWTTSHKGRRVAVYRVKA